MKLRSILLASLLAVSAASQPLQVSAQAVDDADVEGFDSRSSWTTPGVPWASASPPAPARG